MKVIGHRGAMTHRVENTLSSFEYAIKTGVEMIELDVQKTIDGKIVVFHDQNLQRLCKKDGYIFETKSSELKDLYLPYQEKIPFLEEVFDLVRGKIPINIELKAENLFHELFELVEKYKKDYHLLEKSILISSFDHKELFYYRKKNPNACLGLLYYGIPVEWNKTLELLDPFSVHLSLDFLNLNFVKELQKYGKKVYVYTVNSQKDFQRIQKIGVDGFFTNNPEMFLK